MIGIKFWEKSSVLRVHEQNSLWCDIEIYSWQLRACEFWLRLSLIAQSLYDKFTFMVNYTRILIIYTQAREYNNFDILKIYILLKIDRNPAFDLWHSITLWDFHYENCSINIDRDYFDVSKTESSIRLGRW